MKKISILLITLLSFISIGCDSGYGDVNTDPNNPTQVPASLLLGRIVLVNQNIMYAMGNGGDMGMCWAQHVSKVQYNDEERYVPRRGAIDGIWNTIYASVIADAQAMQSLAEKEGNTNLQGVALILKANGFQILTDLYGPVPFTEFYNTTISTPAYDSQELVYAGIIDLLTQADALLANGSGTISASADLVYGGNASKWRKLGNSLKLKALMRISKKQNVSAQVQALVNSGNLMSSNSDSAQIQYLGAQPDANPIYETVIFGNRLEYKVSSVLVDKLSSLNDERLKTIATPIANGSYVGNIPGEENSSNYAGFSGLGSFYLDPTSPGVILSYAQVQFLLAEAANEGYISGGLSAASNYYNNGITASFNFNNVGAFAPAYLGQSTVLLTTQTDARRKIAEQSWIALFGQGFEAWTEWRRTGFPVLAPVVSAAEPSIPSRLYYNSTEESINRNSYNAAVSTLVGGDELTSRLWFMN